jgi:hypothetical protein
VLAGSSGLFERGLEAASCRADRIGSGCATKFARCFFDPALVTDRMID